MKINLLLCCLTLSTAFSLCNRLSAQTVINTPAISWNTAQKFSYDDKDVAHYGLGWYHDTWFTYGPTAYISSYGGLKFFALGVPVVSITSNGNMGIGTNSPTEKLAVNGNIRAREIKVDSGPWPDYVFNENYQLKSLAEVETFIKTNKHLPGIPNQNQVEKEGVNLGEMNRKLLEKVEELTLYVIELKKELDRVKK